jgi:multiple sugar transport system permease protein
VNTTARWRGLFRTVFYLPALIPAVASILLIWRVALFGTNGAADRIYHVFDPDGQILWLDQHGRLILILFMVWSTAGLGMMVFLAGLQNMSRELQEAARADGATRSQIFRTITLPLLTPVIFLQLVLGLISTSQMMIQPILFGSGDYGGQSPFFWVPRRGTDVLSSEIWGSSFRSFALSYGAALSWILFLIVLAITLLLFGTSKRWVFYNAD